MKTSSGAIVDKIPLPNSGLYPGNLVVGLQGEAYFGKKNPKLYPCVIRALNSDGTIKVQWEDGTFTKKLPQSKFYFLLEEEGSCDGECSFLGNLGNSLFGGQDGDY